MVAGLHDVDRVPAAVVSDTAGLADFAAVVAANWDPPARTVREFFALDGNWMPWGDVAAAVPNTGLVCALVFAPGGQPRVVVDFVLEDDRIVEISMIANPDRIAALGLKL